MKTKILIPDRVIAHLQWLEAPYVGRSAYIVERDGKLGYVPATDAGQRFQGFVAEDDPDVLEKAFGTLRRARRKLSK